MHQGHEPHLPVPDAKFETVVVKPSETQKAMVQELSRRAAEIHSGNVDTEHRKAVSIMRFMVKVLLPPLVLVSAFLALMLRWTLNLSAFILALPMMYIFGCGLYTLYCREWTQFLILLAAEFGCFLLITAGTVIVEAVEWFSGWIAEL